MTVEASTGTVATVAALLEILDDAAELMTAAIAAGRSGAQGRAALELLIRARTRLDAYDWIGAGGVDGYDIQLPEDLLHAAAPLCTRIPVDLISACLNRATGPLRLLAEFGDVELPDDAVANTLWSTDGWIETTRRLLERVDADEALDAVA